MTPLQRFVLGIREEIGGTAMSRRAWQQGHSISAQRISQIINDPPKRLPAPMIEALAAACGVRPMAIAMLEDEGFFSPTTQTPPAAQRRVAND